MKTAALALAASALLSQASAHYIFEIFNGGAPYANIRQNTDYNSPVTDVTSNDLRCNVGGATGGSTTTATVAAGSTVKFTLDTPVYHDGPISFYMSKAPGAASDYDGSGPWFKIKDIGPDFSSGSADWTATQQGSFSVEIPSCIPPGDYLLRPQSLAIHNPYPAGTPQFYIECAQITVTGGGSTTPGPTALIPGYITGTEPGYTVNIYSNFKNYTVPGPAVFSCGAGGSSPAPAPPSSSSAKPTTTAAKPTTTSFVTSAKITTTTAKTTTTSAPSAACAAKYGQCGGTGWTGATCCASGSTCTANGAYYSQCV